MSLELLPPLRPPPSGGLLFWKDQWDWHVDTQQKIYAGVQATYSLLKEIQMSETDLTAAVEANTAATQALVDTVGPLLPAIQNQIDETARLLDLLAQGPAPSPAVADAIAKLQLSTDSLATAKEHLQSAQASLEADDASMPPV